MTDWREQIESVISGRTTDRIPAIFRLSRWYRTHVRHNDLPPEVAGMSLPQIEDHLGLARSARYAKVFRIAFRSPVECVVLREGDRVITEYRTPRRTLRRVARYGPGDEIAGIDPSFVEFPIRSWEDYDTFIEIMRHMEFVPAYDEYNRYDREIGRAGLPMVVIGAIPFHWILQEWTGYEKGFLDLFDRPDIYLRAVAEANTVYRRMWEVVADSPARLVMHGINFDTHTTPPPMFREHFLPHLKEFNRLMHDAGKRVACHADGNMTGLLELTLEADFDVADCFACAPLVDCTVAQARAVWKNRITIWGALPSTLLEPGQPPDALRAHLEQLYRDVVPGNQFILGITDMAMPTTSWSHLLVVRDWLRDHTAYPLCLPPVGDD